MRTTAEEVVGIERDESHHGCQHPIWRLETIRDGFDEVRELRHSGGMATLWAAVRRGNDESSFVKVSFFEFESCLAGDGSEMKVVHLLTTEGPSEALREARHSWWGDEGNGYCYYMDFANVRAALLVLEEFFDGG